VGTANKDQIILDWAATNPLLTDALLFSHLAERDGSCAIVPIQGDRSAKNYIDGSSLRVYDFALQLLRLVSITTDTTNTSNMHIQHEWANWIMEQEKIGNYPDFGERCSDYRLELLSNMPMLAERYENGMGKYQFYARLNYFEEA